MEVEETNPNAKTKLEPRSVRSKRKIAKRARKPRRTVKKLARNARNKQHSKHSNEKVKFKISTISDVKTSKFLNDNHP